MWNVVWRMAGNRDSIRPYFLRVGAGAAFDALRGHLISNATAIFESSYQPQHIHQEIMPLIYRVKAAGENSELYKALQDATLLRYPNTPLYPTQEDRELFEQGQDITALREEHIRQKKVHGSYNKDVQIVLNLIVEERRKAYFKEADRRRALEQPTGDIPIPRGIAPDPQPHDKGAYVGLFLVDRNLGGPKRTEIFCGMLIKYLGYRTPSTDGPVSFAKRPSLNRNGLARHNRDQHFHKGTFNQPIHCPLRPKFVKSGVVIFAKSHGLKYVPGKPGTGFSAKVTLSKIPNTRSAWCLLCEQLHFPGNSHPGHVNKNHERAFAKPFECPEFRRLGLQTAIIQNRNAWLEHTRYCHQQDRQTGVTEPW
ncbi:hypothetical protein QBC36DRAFT_353190 [Triangularia setosa]|uniref:Uncharacterized protein n=1 Tax=Triangularia setosa TaxID=2587417 RepID=A0AAN7A7D0_9PEZI|nr:hypothetical protein QBC36DRAFT_353190 [Podospora setosa]